MCLSASIICVGFSFSFSLSLSTQYVCVMREGNHLVPISGTRSVANGSIMLTNGLEMMVFCSLVLASVSRRRLRLILQLMTERREAKTWSVWPINTRRQVPDSTYSRLFSVYFSVYFSLWFFSRIFSHKSLFFTFYCQRQDLQLFNPGSRHNQITCIRSRFVTSSISDRAARSRCKRHQNKTTTKTKTETACHLITRSDDWLFFHADFSRHFSVAERDWKSKKGKRENGKTGKRKKKTDMWTPRENPIFNWFFLSFSFSWWGHQEKMRRLQDYNTTILED